MKMKPDVIDLQYIADCLPEEILLDQLVEECTELAQAAAKVARIIRKVNPARTTMKRAMENMKEEPVPAVVISIKPEYCRMIAKERKFVEVRKSRPKVETPFRAYIYCTKGKDILTYETYCGFDMEDHSVDFQANGHVIGEFVCDHVYQFTCGHLIDGIDITAEEIAPLTGLTVEQLRAYETSAEPKENCLYPIGLYGWRITKLKMYDKPRELAELGMEKPPQSWRYVKMEKGYSDGKADLYQGFD